MAITQAFTTSCKKELLQAGHKFTAAAGNTFKLALYTSSATLGATTTVYSSSNEVGDSGTYSAGGGALTNVEPTNNGTSGITDFNDLAFTSATITAAGALIYNSSVSNTAVVVLDFGANKTSTAGTFTIIFPAAAAGTAIIEIA